MSFDVWDDRYQRRDSAYGEEANDFLREFSSHLKSGSKVLCLAEGEGRNAVYLAKQGHQVTALDYSEVGLQKARKLAQKEGVQISTLCADLADWKPQESQWDAVVAIWMHLPVNLRKDVHQKVTYSLTKDGVYLFEAYRPEQVEFKTGGPPTAEWMYDAPTITKEMPTLDWIHLIDTQREIHEGELHHGMSAVVQGVGRKRG